MGLKYSVFMVRGTADDLYRKLMEENPKILTDKSDLMRKEHDWLTRKVTTVEDIRKEPDPDLAEFMKKDRNELWFMDHPTKEGFVVGGYTSFWLHDAEFTSYYATMLKMIGVDEFVRIQFNHGSNDGGVYKIHMQGETFVEDYKHEVGEDEHWEKYAKRVDKLSGFPIVAWHKYLSDPKIHLVPWKYCLEIKKKEKKNDDQPIGTPGESPGN